MAPNQYNFPSGGESFVPDIAQNVAFGLRAQRFRQFIERVGQDLEVLRAIPHTVTYIPVGSVTMPSEFLYRANLYPPEEIMFDDINYVHTLKGYITVNGETTKWTPNLITVQVGSFSLINKATGQPYVENIDYIVDYQNGLLSLAPTTSIPFNTYLLASYFIQEPCVDFYTMSGRPECPYDSGAGYIFSNGAGIIDKDNKTMLFDMNGETINQRDQSVLSVTNATGGTGYVPIIPAPLPIVSGFESQPVPPPVISEGPGDILYPSGIPRFSNYNSQTPFMLVTENAEDNLLLYSSFEEGPLGSTNIIGWTPTNLVATYDNTYFMNGVQSALLDTTSSTNIQTSTPGLFTQSITLNPGNYLFYAHVRTTSPKVIEAHYPIYISQTSADAGIIPFSLYVSTNLVSSPVPTNYVRLPFDEEGWFRLEYSFTVPPGSPLTLNLGVWLDFGNQCWVDAVQLQDQNIYSTSYIPTSASPASRAADVVSSFPSLGNMSIYRGGISMRVRPNWTNLQISEKRMLFQWGLPTDTEHLNLYYLAGQLTLEMSTLNDSGNVFVQTVTLPWNNTTPETTYIVSATWDNTTGIYLGINNVWAENTFFGFPWKPKNYPQTFQLFSDGTTNFDCWASDVVGWLGFKHPQDALTDMTRRQPLIFDTNLRFRAIIETPHFSSNWTQAGYFQESDVYITVPPDFKFSSDNIGNLEEAQAGHLTLFRTKVRIRGMDYRVMIPDGELTFFENEVIGKRFLLRLIQTSDQNRI